MLDDSHVGRPAIARVGAAAILALGMTVGGAGGDSALGQPGEVLAVHPRAATIAIGDTVRLRAFFCPFRSTGSFFGDDGEPRTADDRCEPARATWRAPGRVGRVRPAQGRSTNFRALRTGGVQVEVEARRSRTMLFRAFVPIGVIREVETPEAPPPVPTEALVVYPFGAEIDAGGSVVFTAWVCPTGASGRPELGADGWPGNGGDGGDVVDDACVLVDADWELQGDAASFPRPEAPTAVPIALASIGLTSIGLAGIGADRTAVDVEPPINTAALGPGTQVIGLRTGTGGLAARHLTLRGGTTFLVGSGNQPTMFLCTQPQRDRVALGEGLVVAAGLCDTEVPIDPIATAFRRFGMATTVDPDGAVTGVQPGYSAIVATDDQGRQAVTNVRVFPPGQEQPIDAFYAQTGVPPAVVGPVQDMAVRELIDSFEARMEGRIEGWVMDRDATLLSHGADATADRVDCGTGQASGDGPGAEILGAAELTQGGLQFSGVFMSQDPAVSLEDWSWALRRTAFYDSATPGRTERRTWLNQVHDGQMTVGELDSNGQAIPGTEATSVSDGVVTFTHPIGSQVPVAIVYEAFDTTSEGGPRICDTLVTVPQPSSLPPAAGGGGCVPTPEALCLNDGRFQVQVSTPGTGGTPIPGIATGLADPTSGLFFFERDDWEMLLRVLNACGLNDRYWVFSAATTNVEYTITVTDTRTRDVRRYSNPLGNPAPAVQDTSAFATCP